MSTAHEIEVWARDEAAHVPSRSRKAKLERLAEQAHQAAGHPGPDAFPVDSPQRLVARSRERRLMQAALNLGFEPQDEQVIKELGLHLAAQSMGLSL
ncbi:hypothetical protein A5904_07670 [Acidithiobacillus caldus]|uniref:hypothetical protein n=1 Tax=Acidithiobacillus caldus TaxID=33059 RepID=UPI0007D978AB|nr:hypothetical protein [Acidithiobacillus caldus]AUW32844.1 hypothetical protein A5904_07670 [Acidithiobacillus caldus]QER45657.1 hypothetical protein F0726_02605 [Acidithiobacillus caldus]